MKVHISFDTITLERALSIIPLIKPYADVIGIGSNLIYQYGMHILEQFKTISNDSNYLIDSKILDRGKNAVSVLKIVQPTWITVMAGASNRTIHATCSTAHNARIKVMMNLLDAASVGQSAMEAENLGIDALIFHQSYDEEDPLAFMDKWDMVRGNTKLPIFLSTNITRENIKELISYQPDGIILGQTIIDAKKPQLEAQFFYELCNQPLF